MYVLSAREKQLRAELEQQVRTSFVLRGSALERIEQLKLYRDRYESFEDYGAAVFGFTKLYIERCITAAQTYYQIVEYLETNGLNHPYPTKQRQLRPIFQADLTPIEAGEVWVLAVSLAMGEVPPSAVVKEAVRAYLQQKYPPINPYKVGQVCRILRGVPGKNRAWCVVAEVRPSECVVDTWDNQYTIPVEDLLGMNFSYSEREQMLDLGERMTALSEMGELDEAALWVLRGLEKLNRAQLNSLEEKLLQVLEEEYLD